MNIFFFMSVLYQILFFYQGEKSYFCDQCEYSTNGRRNLYLHQKHKHNSFEFSCEQCLYQTNFKSRLILHKEKYHKAGEDNCIYCKYKGTDLQDLRSHLSECHTDHKEISNQNHTCDKCPFKSKSRPELDRHIECIHGTKEYRCEHCEYTTRFAKELRKHYLYRHKPGSDRIPCDQCHFTTLRADALKRHVEAGVYIMKFIHN